jgi:DNA-binding transcriptional MerR regulator
MAPSGSTSGSDGASPASRPRKAPEASAEPGELSIGELAELTSVSTRTIRYYEELGILPAPTRTPGGTRRYSRDYIFYVEGAKTLKQLGFGLDQLAELGQFALTGTTASERTQAILQERLTDLDHRIRVLNRLHDIVAEAATSKKDNASAVPELLRWVSSEGRMNTPAS